MRKGPLALEIFMDLEVVWLWMVLEQDACLKNKSILKEFEWCPPKLRSSLKARKLNGDAALDTKYILSTFTLDFALLIFTCST